MSESVYLKVEIPDGEKEMQLLFAAIEVFQHLYFSGIDVNAKARVARYLNDKYGGGASLAA